MNKNKIKMNDIDYMNDASRKYHDESTREESFQMYRKLFEKGYNENAIGEWLLGNDPVKENKPKVFDRLLEITTDENKKIELKIKYYQEFLMNPDIYDLKIKQLERYQKNVEILLNDISILKNNDIGNYQFCFFSNYQNMDNIQYIIKKEEIELHRVHIDFKKNEYKKIAFIHLPKDSSPSFLNFIDIYAYLSQINNQLILYIDNTENELTNEQKKKLEKMQIKYIGGKSDLEVFEIIKNDNIDILISNYGDYLRKKVFMMKPCKIFVRCIEFNSFYPNYYMDLNLNNKNLFNKKSDIINCLNFNKPLIPIPNYNKDELKYLKRIKYDYNRLNIGIIGIARKFDKNTFRMIEQVLKIKNIFLTIYTTSDKLWFKKNLNYPINLDVKTYSNHNLMELSDNILFLDTYFCNNHSTAMEILSIYRPIISFYNKDKIFGKFTYDIISYLDMKDELLADNINDYVNLVKKYVSNHKEYYKMFKKINIQINKTKILNNEDYAKDLYNSIENIDIDNIYEKNKFKPVKEKTFIIARYNENIDYILERDDLFKDGDIIIYNKGNKILNKDIIKRCQIINLKNKGRDGHTFLYHIVINYENLSKINIFLPASFYISEFRKEYTLNMLNELNTNQDYSKSKIPLHYLNKPVNEELHSFILDYWKCTNQENQNNLNEKKHFLKISDIRPFGKWYEKNILPFIGKKNTNVVSYGCFFAITKKDILKNNIDLYKNLIKELDHHHNPETLHYMERSFASLFCHEY